MKQYAIDDETREFLLNGERMRRFTDRLRSRNRITIRLPEVWESFLASFTDLPSGPQRRLWLLTLLQELERAGQIALPVCHGRQWDRTSDVELPTAIRLLQNGRDEVAFDWKSYPWHPKLQWVLERRYISADDIEFLLRINQGLVEGWFAEREPFKYRSLQLTGNEKRLSRLASSALFGTGKLSLELLGCEEEILPLATVRISAQPTMLLFENAASFMVARGALMQTSGSRIGCIGYGAGHQVVKSVGYFAMIEPPISEILYVGDLDGEGIQIASLVSRASNQVPVRPATRLHLAMFEAAAFLGAPDGWPVKDDKLDAYNNAAFDFLDEQVRSRVVSLVQSNRRIPEEVISHSAMRSVLRDC